MSNEESVGAVSISKTNLPPDSGNGQLFWAIPKFVVVPVCLSGLAGLAGLMAFYP
jgi:hypothetical protein